MSFDDAPKDFHPINLRLEESIDSSIRTTFSSPSTDPKHGNSSGHAEDGFDDNGELFCSGLA